jgi:hypothetical protein
MNFASQNKRKEKGHLHEVIPDSSLEKKLVII